MPVPSDISELPQETRALPPWRHNTLKVDVRLIVAINRDLSEEVRSGRFRSDLFYRLKVFLSRLPPLRERREDIPLLVSHVATKHGTRFKRPISRIDRRTMSALGAYEWPGNVRELENTIERAVILSTNGRLRLDRDALPPRTAPTNGDLNGDLRVREREAIEAARRPERCRHALGLAAVDARVPPRLGIDKFSYRRDARATDAD
jgi:DNA-binding NtrC family response regulator